MAIRLLLLIGAATAASSAPAPAPWVNHYDGENPLGIAFDKNRSNNYFLVLGDWGAPQGSCQEAVAAKMEQYVRDQRARGKTLLFIASVGDNFYWSGMPADGGLWGPHWLDVYGGADPTHALHDVPWLAVLGNHDVGAFDPYAACPSKKPLAVVDGQAYGSNQFNKDKNPARPASTNKFWLPDYNYHYAIPELSLELMAVDTNADHVGELNGAGHSQVVFDACGGEANVIEHLGRVKAAGEELLRTRARVSNATTAVIMQHYDGGSAASSRKVFEDALRERRTVDSVSVYGHAHLQACQGSNAKGQCDMILTGGGGGCCSADATNFGFTAIHLTDDGGYTADVTSGSVKGVSCGWRRLSTFV